MSDKRCALESTIIAHGMPYPDNVALAQAMEMAVKSNGGDPKTIAIVDGEIKIGVGHAGIAEIGANAAKYAKASAIDIAVHIEKKTCAATTVSATARLAHGAGIRVFATGGIGGVHRGDAGDVSHDLHALSTIPIAVVSSGAKAILDLPKTLEMLETLGVLVLGYQCDEFPAFYSRTSGLKLEHRIDDYREVAEIARTHWKHGGKGVLVCNPVPAGHDLDPAKVETVIAEALARPDAPRSGKTVTPYLLAKVREAMPMAGHANQKLAISNASLGGAIASALG